MVWRRVVAVVSAVALGVGSGSAAAPPASAPGAGLVIEYVFPTVAPLGPGGAFDDAVPPETPEPIVARRLLSLLSIVDGPPSSLPDYDRVAAFGKWADFDGNGCSTRHDVLRLWAGATAGVTGCYPRDREFTDPYTGAVVRAGHGVQVDHVVALSEAWTSGAWAWSHERRVEFANDLRNLIPTAGPVNQDKGDDRPDEWMPPDPGYACEYAAVYVGAKSHYGLAVVAAEEAALRAALASCGSGTLGP